MIEIDPKTVVWEFTLECDSNCIHCGSDAKKPRKNELSKSEAIDLVEQISDIGFDYLVLSGGEPTLRKDWPEIAKKIKDEKMLLGIISNGLSWNEKTIDKLLEIEPYSVGFSVDGEREIHDYLRGVRGSHKKVFDNIRELKKNNQTVCAITAVSKKNLSELPKMRDRLMVYEVDAWQIQITSPMGRMKEKEELILDEDEYYQLGKFIEESRQQLPHMNIQGADCIGYFGSLDVREGDWSGCGAGIKGLGIDSDGTIRGCLSIRSPEAIEGNIRETELKEIWNDPDKFKYNRSFNLSELKGKCKDCKNGLECKGGCQSQSMAFYDEFHRAPYCHYIYEKRGGLL